jgi:hypothetical protein
MSIFSFVLWTFASKLIYSLFITVETINSEVYT